MNDYARYGITLIRVGLAGVLLWFGAQQLLHTIDWVGYVPDHILQLTGISGHTFVQLNGISEIAFGTLLLLGVFTRPVALLMGVHLAAIAFSLGHTAVAIRDWGLTFALLGLVLTGAGAFAFDKSE